MLFVGAGELVEDEHAKIPICLSFDFYDDRINWAYFEVV